MLNFTGGFSKTIRYNTNQPFKHYGNYNTPPANTLNNYAFCSNCDIENKQHFFYLHSINQPQLSYDSLLTAFKF
jgi:hypothetical protein